MQIERWQKSVDLSSVWLCTSYDGSVRAYSVQAGEKHLEVSVSAAPAFVPRWGAVVVSVGTQPHVDTVSAVSLVVFIQSSDHTYRQRGEENETSWAHYNSVVLL